MQIADECSVAMRLDERLRERHLGIIQGMPYRDMRENHPKIWDAWTQFRSLPPEAEAEPDDEVKQRMESAFYAILEQHPGGTVALVGHGGTMRSLFRWNVGNASITTVLVGPGKSWRVTDVDNEKHLPGPTLKLGDLTNPAWSRPLEGLPVTTIMLCRHGESWGNKEKKFQGTLLDMPLCETGYLQGLEMGRFLKTYGLAALWTSPQIRARQTTEVISSITGAPWHQDSRLSERHLGKLQGVSHEEVKTRWPKAWSAWKAYLPLPDEIGAEPRPAVVDRLESVLYELALSYPGKRVGVIIHGANGRCLLKRSIGNGSITTLQIGPGRLWHVQQVGYASHLPDALAKDAIKASKL
jgi:broad specificity phosphatase PhoE